MSRELRQFKDKPEFREVIYRIYSRKDKQIGENPFKADGKIAKKLSELRATKGNVSSASIDGIIGVTVVTYFTSERDTVADALESPNALTGLHVGQRDLKKKEGYHAIHFAVTSKKPALRGLLCEVQVKTLLDDGWATKTHDVVYKPKSSAPIDPQLKKQMEILGESVRLIEQQSDLLKRLIEQQWIQDKQRRAAAQRQLLLVLTSDPQLPGDDDMRRSTAAIGEGLRNDLQGLRSCDQSSEVLRKYLDIWENLVNQGRHTQYSCRLITLLASLRDGGELNNVARHAINEWIALRCIDDAERVHAHAFRALANIRLASFRTPHALLTMRLNMPKNR